MTDLLRILIAPLVWLACFSTAYGLHGLICGHNLGGEVFALPVPRAPMVLAYVFAVILQIVLLVALYLRQFESPSGFVRLVSRTTGWVGLIAAVWSLFPVVMITSCN